MATLRYDCGVYGVAGATRIGGRHESSIHCSVRSLDIDCLWYFGERRDAGCDLDCGVQWHSSTDCDLATGLQSNAPRIWTGVATDVPISDFVAYAPVGNVTSITYYNSAAIPLTFSTVPFGGIIFAGPQAYTGSEAAPQFAPGAFFGLFEGDSAVPSLLIFSIPEPSTWS
jgi:hypothetical protein